MSGPGSLIMRRIGIAMGMLALSVMGALAQSPAPKDPWPELASNIFSRAPLADGTGLLALEMPARADDAAIVPLTVRSTLPSTDIRRVRSFTIVIDENPAPVAATFHIGPGAVVPVISTRVRVNSYTNVHAVAELSDGKLYVVKTYVKASGGCSAPAVKADKINIGEMRFRQFTRSAEEASNTRTAQLMIRHPNNSGLQMDQITHLNIPPFFVDSLKVWQGTSYCSPWREESRSRKIPISDLLMSLTVRTRCGPKPSTRRVTYSAAVGRHQTWSQSSRPS
jgi:sulfur-oxidizing protein SoxY